MLLKTTTNGLIVDGFLVGTPQVDMLMDVDIDGRNNLHAAGFIGSEFQLPAEGPPSVFRTSGLLLWGCEPYRRNARIWLTPMPQQAVLRATVEPTCRVEFR